MLAKNIKWISSLYRQPSFQIALFTLAVLFSSAFAVFYFENQEIASNINSLWDGIWWAVVTMGTVGYGDRYPISVGGRIVGLLLIFSGVGLMSLLTATIASIFVEKRMKEGKGLETVKERDHVVICGWNEYTEDVLKGLTRYGSMGERLIVLINERSVDEVDALRLNYNKFNLKFLRGDYAHENVLLRANITKAKFALIVADISGGRPRDRADERTTLTALTIKTIAPQTKIIAELLDSENRPHLKRAGVDDIVIRGENVGSLLASAVNSPGLPRIISNLLSLGDTNKFWRVDIPRAFVGRTFKELALFFREKQQAILLGLVKEKKAMKLEDILSDNTSVIDQFIKEKIKEAKKDFYYERGEAQASINPEDDYIISSDDFAVLLARKIPPENR